MDGAQDLVQPDAVLHRQHVLGQQVAGMLADDGHAQDAVLARHRPHLHEAMKPYCPPPYPSTFAAYAEIIPAIIRQIREPGWSVQRPIPRDEPVHAVPAE